MSDDIEINIGTKMAESLRAFAELNKSVAAVVAKVDAVGKESQKTDQIQKRLGDEARRTWEATRTGAEKASQQQATYNKLLKDGYIDQETYNRAMQKLGPTAESSFSKLKGWASSTAGQIVSATAIVGTLQRALAAVNAEFDAVSRRQDRAAAQQLGEGPAIREMVRSLGSDADLTPSQATKLVGQIAYDTKADRGAAYQAAASVLSARGEKPASEVLNNDLRATLKLDPSFDGSKAGTIAPAGIQLRTFFGGTAEQAQGMLVAGQQTSNVGNAEQYAKGTVPFLLQAKNYGLTAKEAVGYTSAFTLGTGDTEGRFSGTGFVQYVKEVEETVLKLDPSMRGKSFQEMENFLMTDPRGIKVRDRMVGVLGKKLGENKRQSRKAPSDELSGEAKVLTTKIGMLTPGSKERGLLEASLAGTPNMEDADEFYNSLIAAQDTLAELQPLKLQESTRAFAQRKRSDPDRGLHGTMRKSLKEVLEESGSSLQITQDMMLKEYELRSLVSGPEDASLRVQEMLEGEKRGLNPTFTQTMSNPEAVLGGLFPTLSPVTELTGWRGRARAENEGSLSKADRAHNQEIDDLKKAIQEWTETIKAIKGERVTPNGAVPALRSGEKVP
jgi:hypothetical protein